MHVEETMAVSVSDRIAPAGPARPAAQDLALPASKTALVSASALAAALLAACGGGGGGTRSTSTTGSSTAGLGTAVSGYSYAKPSNDTEAARFMQQAQFSASDADIAAVRDQGYASWVSAQLNAPGAQTGVQWLDSRGYGIANATTGYFDNSYPADFMIWQQLFQSVDGVRKRCALALSELFVVSTNSIDYEFRSHAMAYYWDLLVQGTWGNFRQLLEDITLSPAMGLFLNTKGNQKENNRGRQPDENYAREVMQLFTIGLYQLNADSTEKRATDGSKVPSYTSADVTNLARVFTGWDVDLSQNVEVTLQYSGYTRNVGNTSRVTRRMVLTASRHSTLAATFLGVTVAANTPGDQALKIALDTLFNHPNVGPFFGRQMIQRLVTSNPSPAYVARVAAVFNNNGDGVRGDMKSVFAAILLDDEARGPAGLTAPGFGKLREPMVRFVQWGRSFGLKSAAGSWKLDEQGSTTDQLGQSPLRPGSVFNFFRPGYVPPSTALAASQQVAPEFQIVNESTVGAYLNYMQDRIRYGFNIDSPGVPEHTYNTYSRDITASYTAELALVADVPALVNRLNLVMCAGQLSANTRALMTTALTAMALPTPTATNAQAVTDAKLNRVCAGVLMVLASAEYLIQK
jgi:uncharacterized protein (DUF1800 family)